MALEKGITNPYYEILLEIEELNLTENLNRVDIVNSINSIYPIIKIQLNANSKEMILEKIYGQNPIDLTIILNTEDREAIREIKWELMAIKIDYSTEQKTQEENKGHLHSEPISIYCVQKDPFIQMTTIVNELFEDGSNKKPIDAVNDIIDSFLEVDSDVNDKGSNDEKIDQIIVPPMAFTKAIKYLNDSFGIYDGNLFYYARLEDGDTKFEMWDLGEQINEPELYKIVLLTEGDDEKEIYEEANIEDNFYIYKANIKNYDANKNAMVKGYKHRFISKPSDGLYHNVDIDLEQIYNENSVTTRNPGELILEESLKNRYIIHNKNYTGYEKTEELAKSFLSKLNSGMTMMTFDIFKNVDLTNVIRVGVPVEFEPKVEEYMEHGGKYIVASSYVILERFTNDHARYGCIVHNRCFRTNIDN